MPVCVKGSKAGASNASPATCWTARPSISGLLANNPATEPVLATADGLAEGDGVPPLPTGYNNNYEIAQAPGLVAILHEEIHEVRLIHLDGRPHIGGSIRQWLGDSRGHWEGDTLVVETVGLDDRAWLDEWGTPFSGDAHIEERWKRTGPDRIELTITVRDPANAGAGRRRAAGPVAGRTVAPAAGAARARRERRVRLQPAQRQGQLLTRL